MNEYIIQREICKKQNPNIPYRAPKDILKSIVVDVDHFPYTRHFRGQYDYPRPIVWDREAGYRKRVDMCYRPTSPLPQMVYPNHAFSAGDSVEFPVHPEYLHKISDKVFMESMLNRSCITGLTSR